MQNNQQAFAKLASRNTVNHYMRASGGLHKRHRQRASLFLENLPLCLIGVRESVRTLFVSRDQADIRMLLIKKRAVDKATIGDACVCRLQIPMRDSETSDNMSK